MNSNNKYRKRIILILGIIFTLSIYPNSFLNISSHKVVVNEIKEKIMLSGITWTVDDDLLDFPYADFTVIEDAINIANDGDTILVYPGVYSENINVNKRINIKSIGGVDVTFIQAPSSSNFGFKVEKNFVNISGFTVKDASYAGILLSEVEYCNISTNNLFDNQFGIVATGRISGIHHGNNFISNNNFSNSKADIYFFYSSNNVVSGNIMEKRGVRVSGNSIFTHTHEIDTSNLVNGKPVYYINGITGEQVPTNVGQVILVNCSDINIANLNINGTYNSIHVVYSSYVNIENNNISYSQAYDIFLTNSNYCNVTYNNFSNSYSGIALANNAHDNKIMANYISNTYLGIHIASSDTRNNELVQNTIIDNWAGIYIQGRAPNNTIKENNFINNYRPMISNSDGYRYLNNFINSTYYSSSSDPTWNSPETLVYTYEGNDFTNYLGNYWEEYSGTDDNNDGIGDTPFHIVLNNYDYYPLMMPFENYLDIQDTISPNTEIISGPSEIINYNDVTFTWTGSDDTTPTQDLVCSYYLEGYDSGWSIWTLNTSKTYNNLPNGDYIFRVRAKDSSGNIDPTPAERSLTISMEPEPEPEPEPESWTFAIITDLHIGRGYNYYEYQLDDEYYLTERLGNAFQEISENKDEKNIKFVVVLGDISEHGDSIELLKAKNILDKLNNPDGNENTEDGIPYFPIIGNHDVQTKSLLEGGDWSSFNLVFNDSFFEQQFQLLGIDKSEWSDDNDEAIEDKYVNYAFSYRGFNFISLDFVQDGSSAELYDDTRNWLRKYLEDPNYQNIVLFSHHPFIHNEFLAFDFLEKPNLESINGWDKVNASFAGHIHGYYDKDKLFSLINEPGLYNPLAIPFSPIFMNANKRYHDTINNIPVITTEALLVGSNEEIEKRIIRIVEIEENKIKNYNQFLGTDNVLNPSLKVDDHNVFNLLMSGKNFRYITVECYAFTRAVYKLKYEIIFENTIKKSPIIIEDNEDTDALEYEKIVKFDHVIYLPSLDGNSINVNLTVYGWSSKELEDPDIVEHINITYNLPNLMPFLGMSPVNMTVIDPEGRIINETINEIPDAKYQLVDIDNDGHFEDLIVITNPMEGNYILRLTGIDIGTYTILSGTFSQEELIKFNATDIPISINELHQFTFNWNAISEGEEGIRIQIDSDGDGNFDYDFYSDSEFNYDEYLEAIEDAEKFPLAIIIIVIISIVGGIGIVTVTAVLLRKRKRIS